MSGESKAQPTPWEITNAQSRVRVIDALATMGQPSLYEQETRAAYPQSQREINDLLLLPRIARFSESDEYAEPRISRFGATAEFFKKDMPMLLVDGSGVQNLEDMALCLSSLDEVADTLTGLFINGGVLHNEGYIGVHRQARIIAPDEELGMDILLHNLQVSKSDREKFPMRKFSAGLPALAESGYKMEFQPETRYDKPRGNAFVVMPDGAKHLSNYVFNQRSGRFDIPGNLEFDLDLPSEDMLFWQGILTATRNLLATSELGVRNWPVRRVSEDPELHLEEHYNYKAVADHLFWIVTKDLITAQPELYPRNSRFSLSGLKRIFSGS